MTTLPPMGCLPAAITLFGSDSNECVARLNSDAVNFNKKLNTTSQSLQKMLQGLKLVTLDIYQPLYDLVTKPSENGTMLFDLSVFIVSWSVNVILLIISKMLYYSHYFQNFILL